MTLISKLISSENTSLRATLSSISIVQKSKPVQVQTPILESEHSFTSVVSLLLENLFDISPKTDEKENLKTKTFCVYNCLAMPSISIEDYLKRIHTYLKLSDESYLLTLVYIDKLIQKTSLVVTSQNIHKFFYFFINFNYVF